METAPLPYADAHVHLQEEVYEDHLPGVMERAREAGVALFISNATHPDDWERTLAIAERYEGVVPCLGVHPWFLDHGHSDWLPRLRDLLLASGALVGEVGLDGLKTGTPLETQRVVLEHQLDLAQSLRRPVMLHGVRAFGHLAEILARRAPWQAPFVMHAFAGSPEIVQRLAAMGGYFSYGGYVLDERHRKARRALLHTPLDRLLIESDAPAMLPPEGYRPHTIQEPSGDVWNEPANIPAVVAGVAALLGLDADVLREMLWTNLQRLLEGPR
ncbi:MAG: TatD family hydrolase [Armatimonadota bacterium]